MLKLLFIIVGIIFISYIIDEFKAKDLEPESSVIGAKLENEVAEILALKNITFVKNVIIPTKEGSTEIDLIVISKKGIYALECKNYEATITCTPNNDNWTANYGRKNYDLYSPVIQNQNHIKNLEILFEDYNFENIVIFGDNAVLSKNVLKHKEVKSFSNFKYFIENIFPNLPNNKKYTDEYLNKLENSLLNTTISKEEHIAYVKSIQAKKVV